MTMAEYIINGKAIYTPKGAALEYGRVGCNFYTGCPHDCEYCYLKRGVIGSALGGTEVKLKKCFKNEVDALEIFCKEARKHIDYMREKGLFFSFTTDPLIPETRDLTISAMNFCIYNDIPVMVLTKDADFINYYRMDLFLESDKAKEMVSFGFTLTGRDDMEKNASKNMERIETMGYLHYLGYKTFASIEPVIDWESSRKVIEASLTCCDHYKIGLRSGVKKGYYNDSYSTVSIIELVNEIVEAHHTVYLKDSVRRLLDRTYPEAELKKFLKMTVDMEGKPIK